MNFWSNLYNIHLINQMWLLYSCFQWKFTSRGSWLLITVAIIVMVTNGTLHHRQSLPAHIFTGFNCFLWRSPMMAANTETAQSHSIFCWIKTCWILHLSCKRICLNVDILVTHKCKWQSEWLSKLFFVLVTSFCKDSQRQTFPDLEEFNCQADRQRTYAFPSIQSKMPPWTPLCDS